MKLIDLPNVINQSNANNVLSSLKLLTFEKNDLTQWIDVSGINHCDSSGISVLIETQSYFRKQGVLLKFSKPSQQLKQMSVLFKIESLLFE